MKNKKKKIYKLPNDHLFEIEMQSTAMHCTKERKTIFIIVIREIVKYQIQMFYTIEHRGNEPTWHHQIERNVSSYSDTMAFVQRVHSSMGSCPTAVYFKWSAIIYPKKNVMFIRLLFSLRSFSSLVSCIVQHSIHCACSMFLLVGALIRTRKKEEKSEGEWKRKCYNNIYFCEHV